MSIHRLSHKESGNTILIVLGVVAIIAIGTLVYFSIKTNEEGAGGESTMAAAAPTEAASQPSAGGDTPADAKEQKTADASKPPVIKPGNPVVAKLKGGEVTRLDVFNYIQSLPPQTRQLPLEQLYPMAVEQVINSKIISEKTKNVNLDNDEEVKKQLAEAKKQITRAVYIEKEVTKRVTDDRLKKAYDEYVKNFPDIQDVKARHILVKEESKAKDLISQLDKGANFEELAKENSTDGTAKSGGDLGYFAKTDVVPAFGDAAFALKVGEYTKKPVKSDFGYHVIKVEDKRKRPPADYEAIKPFLEAQVRRQILDETIQEWRDEASIERFDINGDPVEPSAGDMEPEAEKVGAGAISPAKK